MSKSKLMHIKLASIDMSKSKCNLDPNHGCGFEKLWAAWSEKMNKDERVHGRQGAAAARREDDGERDSKMVAALCSHVSCLLRRPPQGRQQSGASGSDDGGASGSNGSCISGKDSKRWQRLDLGHRLGSESSSAPAA
ncbi:hypothetical protein EJB05_12671, partial [Eragrostis curvula]